MANAEGLWRGTSTLFTVSLLCLPCAGFRSRAHTFIHTYTHTFIHTFALFRVNPFFGRFCLGTASVDQKSRKVISGLRAQDSLAGLCEAFFGAAETLQKRLCHTLDTPQKRSKSHPHLHLYVFSHRGEFHDQCARWSTPNARASAPSSVLRVRPLTPDSAPELGTCFLKMFELGYNRITYSMKRAAGQSPFNSLRRGEAHQHLQEGPQEAWCSRPTGGRVPSIRVVMDVGYPTPDRALGRRLWSFDFSRARGADSARVVGLGEL